MTNAVMEMDGFLEEASGRIPLSIRILSPMKTDGEQDYFCIVQAPMLFGKDKKIFGVDAEQASSLAVGFIKTLLDGRNVVDRNGVPLKL